MRGILVCALGLGLLSARGSVQDKSAKDEVKLWAAISVNHPVYDPGVYSVDNFVVYFGLVNDGDKTIDPKAGESILYVNGKALDNWDITINNGPKSANWQRLAPGRSLQFTYALGDHFRKPGIYKLRWKGKDFEAPEIVLRVLPSKK